MGFEPTTSSLQAMYSKTAVGPLFFASPFNIHQKASVGVEPTSIALQAIAAPSGSNAIG